MFTGVVSVETAVPVPVPMMLVPVPMMPVPVPITLVPDDETAVPDEVYDQVKLLETGNGLPVPVE